MFRGFGKVFRFTFRHQVQSGGYRILTIALALVLFAAPAAALIFADRFHEKHKDKALKPCGAERVIIADDLTERDDFSWLSFVAQASGYDDYAAIRYERMDRVEEALQDVKNKGEKRTLVVRITKEEDGLESLIIIPDNSEMKEKEADHLNSFLKKESQFFMILASGLSFEDLQELSIDAEYDVFDGDGYAAGNSLLADSEAKQEKENDDILMVFRMIVTYVCMFVIYFVVLVYGASIMNCVVMEKTSKLMDTMLISVSPEAMIFGKMLGVLLAGVIQLVSWVLALILGFVTGYQVVVHTNPGSSLSLIRFLKAIGDMGVFTPGRLTVAIFVLCFAVIMYAALATVGGAIASTKEEVASNQSLFTIILVISFFIVMSKALSESVPLWMCLIPFTAAMALPGAAAAGSISFGMSLLGFGIMLICSLVFIYLAGRLYRMMALYKGNKVSYTKAFQMLLNVEGKK